MGAGCSEEPHSSAARPWLAFHPWLVGGSPSEPAIHNLSQLKGKQALGLSLHVGSKGMDFSGKMVHAALCFLHELVNCEAGARASRHIAHELRYIL